MSVFHDDFGAGERIPGSYWYDEYVGYEVEYVAGYDEYVGSLWCSTGLELLRDERLDLCFFPNHGILIFRSR
jgi:hypothetical protein